MRKSSIFIIFLLSGAVLAWITGQKFISFGLVSLSMFLYISNDTFEDEVPSSYKNNPNRATPEIIKEYRKKNPETSVAKAIRALEHK